MTEPYKKNTGKNTAAMTREVTYHYSGKVHVRGLLRRVWRPRYLALGDDGYLRYHESIPPLIQQEEDGPSSFQSTALTNNNYHVHHTHRPKTILAILDGARTIDPHSVVDNHVALPQGVYGFVFRGRPVELHPNNDIPSATSRDTITSRDKKDNATPVVWDSRYIVPREFNNAVIVPRGSGGDSSSVVLIQDQPVLTTATSKKSAKAAVVDLVFPKGTSRRRTAQTFAKKAINPDVLCVGIPRVSTNCVSGDISRTSSSSSLMMEYEKPLIIDGESRIGLQESTTDDYLYPSHEWGCDSHESRETLGSFQEVDGVHVYSVHIARSTSKKTEQKAIISSFDCLPASSSSVSVQSREYLCAVSTAEEAESWVVALRWAAEHRRSIRYRNVTRASESINVAVPHSPIANLFDILESDRHIIPETRDVDNNRCKDKVNSVEECNLPSNASLLSEREGLCTEECNERSEMENQSIEEVFSSAATPLLLRMSPPNPAGATVLVTKVTSKQLLTNAFMLWNLNNDTTTTATNTLSFFPIHLPLPGDELLLQYEIQLLLLRHCNPRNGLVYPETVEQRTITKSILDVLDVVHHLLTEFKPVACKGVEVESFMMSQDGPRGMLQPSSDTSRLLEDVESNILSCLDSFVNPRGSHQSRRSMSLLPHNMISEINTTMTKAVASISTIDNVLRKLSKDGKICCSNHFQQFLSLHPTNQASKSKPSMIDFAKDADAEQIVRKWLSMNDNLSMKTNMGLALAVALRHRCAGIMISVVAIWSTAHIANLFWSAVVSDSEVFVDVSFETYAVVIALSFFLGRNSGVSSRSKYDLEKHTRQFDYPMMSPSMMSRSSMVSHSSVKSTKAELPGDIMLIADDDDHSTVAEERDSEEFDEDILIAEPTPLSSPLPMYPLNHGICCWSKPDNNIFLVRGPTYLADRMKIQSSPAIFECRGIDVWITDNAERHIARHPAVLGGYLDREDTLVMNFLLPFGNFVAYFTIPPLEDMPSNISNVWTKFIRGNQQYRDGKLKLLPVVVDGPWIVKKAVGPGTSPAMLGKDLPLQYYFTDPTRHKKGVYEVDVLVTASRIARGILNVVKGHSKSLTIALGFIIEASEEVQLPETVLCACQVHSLHFEDCPNLPDSYPDG